MRAAVPTEPIATFEASIPVERIDAFFKAVGWQLSGLPAMPPTLATLFRQGELEALNKLGIPLAKVLHGEQKYKFLKNLKAGEKYRGETFLLSQYEKSGGSGKMGFYILQTSLIDSNGELCVECSATVIARG